MTSVVIPLVSRAISPFAAEHAKDFVREVRAAIRHRRGVRQAKKYSGVSGLRINFGSGPHKKEGFLNVDLSGLADLQLDLRRPIPLESASCSVIMSEHFMEHLRYPEEAESFADECFRLLEAGGRFFASVPNAERVLRGYVEREPEWMESERKYHPAEFTTPMEFVNDAFRQRPRGRTAGHFECHCMAYDIEVFQKLLGRSGFVDVRERAFDPALDSDHRRYSLFVSARKPAD